MISYLVGARDGDCAQAFMEDCASRIRNRVQITTDALNLYLEAVEGAFGGAADYAMLHKLYGAPSDEDRRRYSPGKCIGTDMKRISGDYRSGNNNGRGETVLLAPLLFFPLRCSPHLTHLRLSALRS